MRYTEEIEAEVTMTVRYTPDGDLTAKASASCEYQPGSTASAAVDLPESTLNALRSALDSARDAVEESLGKALAQSKRDAFRVAATQGEVNG